MNQNQFIFVTALLHTCDKGGQEKKAASLQLDGFLPPKTQGRAALSSKTHTKQKHSENNLRNMTFSKIMYHYNPHVIGIHGESHHLELILASRGCVTDYHPISILPIFSKPIEKNHVLSTFQFSGQILLVDGIAIRF
ncbi:MAG: hypothetical protein O7D30_03450 [Rickettsia endosymbiont of Ixodes persulcatus]|nr:hypothetical protein [Rickettsia endosymbiont of Ixodes persulcatus]